jgi:hypothetical protein
VFSNYSAGVINGGLANVPNFLMGLDGSCAGPGSGLGNGVGNVGSLLWGGQSILRAVRGVQTAEGSLAIWKSLAQQRIAEGRAALEQAKGKLGIKVGSEMLQEILGESVGNYNTAGAGKCGC